MDNDKLRSLALASSCAAFIAVPNVGALAGGGEKTDRYDTVITPPSYAFAVWAPIFAACAIDTRVQCTADGRTRPSSRRTGWPLTAAYLTNTAWSLAAQTDRFQYTPALLPLATSLTAVAHNRLRHVPPSRSTSTATGMLLGWTALASTVNILADAVRRGAPPHSRTTITAAATGLLVTGAALTARITRTPTRGALAVAAPAVWGLLTTSADRRRPPTIRAVSAAAALALGGIAGWRRSVKPT
ncbi:hypothetical protein [Actinophytocola oryzae]|uniref:TspO/MBR related protein n=1 Tax=Actinophytocola oryzae TaxID=502181 RepID=A0A4R7VHU7_9PSEU|nr:hypothetical protein [Actinophytocola oryzae]TDV48669.1 hypothetical protein CLV71_10829 [Actinophytocola oryzae]